MLFLYFLTHIIFLLSLSRLLNKFTWLKSESTHKEVEAEALSRADVEKSLRALKQEQVEMSEKLKAADQAYLSVEAGLKTVERQAKDQCQKLHLIEIDLATER